jgi:predicted Zn finger-like uncharacterized protein
LKVKCPKCGAAAQADASKIPEQGARAKCPSCGTPFLIKKQPHQARPQAYKSTTPRPPRGQRLPYTPPERESEPWDDPDYEMPVVYTDIERGRGCSMMTALFVVLVVGLALIGLQKTPGEKAGDDFITRLKPLEKATVPSYSQRHFDQDLAQVRRRIIRRNYTAYRVEREGPEMRILRDFFDYCGRPCDVLVDAEIRPLDTRDGFEANVWCYEQGRPVLKYLWTFDSLWVDGNPCR